MRCSRGRRRVSTGSGNIVKLACGEVNDQLFAASGIAPRNVYAVPLLRQKKDEDFKPASKAEQAAEENADDEAAAAAMEGQQQAEPEPEPEP